MKIKAFTCGFFETSKFNLKNQGEKLIYLGGEFEIYEEKYLVKYNDLKFSQQDWNNFFKNISIET